MTFVEGGGGLLVALGPRATWPRARDVAAGDARPASMDRTRGAAAKLSGFDYGHAVFEPFRAPRSGDFSTARFYGYRVLTAGPGRRTCWRASTPATPALVEGTLGRGRVLVLASTLDLVWNDLALKPVFLPFVHQLARQAVELCASSPAWATVGQAVGRVDDARGDAPSVILSPVRTAA